jgi:hypothetical protein
MKIRSNLSAGMTFAECDQQRSWWKKQAEMMEVYAKSSSKTPPAGLWFPTTGTPSNPTYPTYPTGGGYVNGVYYADKSGVCGTGTLPPTTTPPTTGGGHVNGVYYPDKSGICV